MISKSQTHLLAKVGYIVRLMVYVKNTSIQQHLSNYKNLQTLKVPMTYIFKTLSYASIASTTTMMDVLLGKIEKLPL